MSKIIDYLMSYKAFRILLSRRNPLFKIYLFLAGYRPTPYPEPTPLPDEPIKVLIAPANSAEQASLWVQALNRCLPLVGATNLVVSTLKVNIFLRSRTVPVGAYHLSRKWQKAEFKRACEFTHVLVESERPIFGSLFGYSFEREVQALRAKGVSVAAISHGSDTRNPKANADRNPWSPFRQNPRETKNLQLITDQNRKSLQKLQLTTFVSTPEMLEDFSNAFWCPTVFDPIFLDAPQLTFSEHVIPRVIHIPTNNWLKGTDIAVSVSSRLVDEGLVDFELLENVPRAEIPPKIFAADILLEQFRIGTYSATAVEAMAAGRVVIGHVLDSARQTVKRLTGLELPVVQATGATLEPVLRDLTENPSKMIEIGQRGKEFARAVHDGKMSATVLDRWWIRSNI